MPATKHPGSVSVAGETYDRLRAHCIARGLFMRDVVDALIEEAIAGRPSPAALVHANAKEIAFGPPAPTPRALLPHRVQLNASWRIVEDVRVAADRHDLPMDVVMDRAVAAMLDCLATTPWCRTCLESSEHCRCSGMQRRVW